MDTKYWHTLYGPNGEFVAEGSFYAGSDSAAVAYVREELEGWTRASYARLYEMATDREVRL